MFFNVSFVSFCLFFFNNRPSFKVTVNIASGKCHPTLVQGQRHSTNLTLNHLKVPINAQEQMWNSEANTKVFCAGTLRRSMLMNKLAFSLSANSDNALN